MAEFVPPEPPKDYYKISAGDELRSGLWFSLLWGTAFGLLTIVVELVLSTASNVFILVDSLFDGLISFTIAFTLLILKSILSTFENRKIRKENFIRNEKLNIRKDKYKKDFDEYDKNYQDYISKLADYNDAVSRNEVFQNGMRVVRDRFENVVLNFETLWSNVETSCRVDAEISDRKQIIEIFVEAFRVSMANKEECALMALSTQSWDVNRPSFPAFSNSIPLPIYRFARFLKMWLFRKASPPFYLSQDDRFLAVVKFLPSLTYAEWLPWKSYLELRFLPTKPQKPKALGELIFAPNGEPLPIEKVVFKEQNKPTKGTANRPQ